MSCWQIREVCELRKEGRLFILSKDQPLTVGQSNDCTVPLKLKSVENRHAVVQWNTKKLCYIIRDLGSTNGTFINNAPLTRATEELRHGDSLRFGHERTHVFRVEENFQSRVKSVPTPPPTLPTSTATQTSPQSIAHPSPPAPDPTPSSPVPTQFPQVLPQGVIFPAGGYFVSGGQHGAVLTPSGPIQYILPQTQGVISLSSPPVFTAPHIQPVFPSTPQFTSPAPPPPETTPTTIHVQDIETESLADDTPLAPQRSDGRRQVELANTPGSATNSKLYGQPSWWGEEQEGPLPPHDTKLKPVTTSGQVLRDLDSEGSRSASLSPSRSSKLSSKDELRLKAITNSLSQEQSTPSSSWVVDFGTTPKPRHHSKPRPRSADPSPIRAPPERSKRVSSATPSSAPQSSRRPRSTTIVTKRETPVSTRGVTSTKKTSGTSSLARSATTRKTTPSSPQYVRRSSLDSISRKKSGSNPDVSKTGGTTNKTYTKSGSKSSSEVKRSSLNPITRRKSGSNPDISDKSSSRTIVEKTYTKIGGQGSSDELQSSLSDVSLTSLTGPVVVRDKTGLKSASDSCVGREGVRVCSSEGGKGGSARKKWTKEQSQTPDSLMLANIEARLRQLSKLAQGAALKLSAMKRGLEEMGVVNREEYPDILPFTSTVEQSVPQWKFSQTKEVHSIFLSMKSVEKWLNDINSTVSTMQVVPQGGVVTREGGVAVESVDYDSVEYETTESELECYQDSIEDNFASCSESYGSD